jgi:hypothetical protein
MGRFIGAKLECCCDISARDRSILKKFVGRGWLSVGKLLYKNSNSCKPSAGLIRKFGVADRPKGSRPDVVVVFMVGVLELVPILPSISGPS